MNEYEQFVDPNATKFRWVVLEPFTEGYKGLAVDFGAEGKFKVIRDFSREDDAIEFILTYRERNFTHRWMAFGWTWNPEVPGYFQ